MPIFGYIIVSLVFLMFLSGMLFQAFTMLRGTWEDGDRKKILKAFFVGLFGFTPFNGESVETYSFALHALFALGISILVFIVLFRKKLMAKVTSQIILIWNLILIGLLVSHFGITSTLVMLAIPPTILTIISNFSDVDAKFIWQVFLRVWFSCVMIAITIFQIANFTNPFDIFFLGAFLLYIFVNIYFVLSIIPTLNKNESLKTSLSNLRNRANELADSYIWRKDNKIYSAVIIIGIPLLMYTNNYFTIVSNGTLIGVALVAISYIKIHNQDDLLTESTITDTNTNQNTTNNQAPVQIIQKKESVR